MLPFANPSPNPKRHHDRFSRFRRLFIKRFALCYRTVFLSVCNVVWMDQDETWHRGRPRPRPHCIRCGPSYTPVRGTAPILAHVRCGQAAGWIKMPLGTEVGLGPGDIVLNGDPALLLKREHSSPPIFGPCILWPNGWMDQDAT